MFRLTWVLYNCHMAWLMYVTQFLKVFSIIMVYLSISKIETAEIIISLPVVLVRNCMVNQLYVLPVFECY